MKNCEVCKYTWSTREWKFDQNYKIKVCDECYKLLKSKPGQVFGQPPHQSSYEERPKIMIKRKII